MKLESWITETITEHKGRSNTIPIKIDLLGFCQGDYQTAALLTQLLYWNDKTRISGKWIAKSTKGWQEELYLSPRQVSRVTKKLNNLKLIETKLKKFGGSPITHYRLNETVFQKTFLEYLKTGYSILTKGENLIPQNVKMDFDKTDKSILTKGKNPIQQNVKMDFDKTGKSITEITTEINSKINSEHKTERDFSVFEEIDFNDNKSADVNSEVIPKEKSCGKKEKVVIQLPFESDTFQLTWNGWKDYLSEKYQKSYSIIEEQAALMPIQNYDEDFSINLILKAISGGWKSFHFSDTPNQFQTYLIKKNKNYEQSGKEFKTNEFKNAVNERSEELWGNFA